MIINKTPCTKLVFRENESLDIRLAIPGHRFLPFSGCCLASENRYVPIQRKSKEDGWLSDDLHHPSPATANAGTKIHASDPADEIISVAGPDLSFMCQLLQNLMKYFKSAVLGCCSYDKKIQKLLNRINV